MQSLANNGVPVSFSQSLGHLRRNGAEGSPVIFIDVLVISNLRRNEDRGPAGIIRIIRVPHFLIIEDRLRRGRVDEQSLEIQMPDTPGVGAHDKTGEKIFVFRRAPTPKPGSRFQPPVR